MFARLLLVCVVAIAYAVPAVAHSPQQHGARLVVFNRPLPAPGFELKDPDGAPVRLADLRGRFVLLNFWATWCPPCVKEMPSMERLAGEMADAPFTVLGISLDAEGAAKVKPFLARIGVTFPIALDPESEVADAYGANDLPSTFFIDPKGRVVLAAKGERDWADPELVDYLHEVMAEHS